MKAYEVRVTETEKSPPSAAGETAEGQSTTGSERSVFATCCRGFMHLSAGVIAGVTIVGLVLAWHLSRGPISLSFLTPYIEAALNERSPDLTVAMDDTILTWAGWERALDIRVIDVSATDNNGVVVAEIPEISFSLSAKALIRDGAIVPKTVELFGPRLTLVRRQDGGIELDLGTRSSGQNFGGGLFSLLFNDPAPGSPVASLERLSVVGAEAVIEDRVMDKVWDAPAADIRLRRDALGITGEVALQVELDGKISDVSAKGAYLSEGRRLNLSIDFDTIRPETLAELHPDLHRFAGIQVPLEGTVTLGMSIDGMPDEVGVRLTGGEGFVTPPEPVAETIPVESVILSGFFDGRARSAEIHEFELITKPGTTVIAPGSKSHRIPVSALRFAGKYTLDDDRLEISRLDVATDGPIATLSGTIEELTGDADAEIEISSADVPLNGLDRYWAPEWSPDVHWWWFDSVFEGVVPRVTVKVRVGKKADGWHVFSAVGDMDVRGATISYMDGMPSVTDADGRVNFTHKRFDAFVTAGKSEGLVLDSGEVFLSGFDDGYGHADINVRLAGDVSDALAMIDHEPLGFAKVMGVDPAKAGGDARVTLNIKVPLKRAVELDDVDIESETRLRNAKIPKALHGFDVSDADLTLSVNKGGMDVRGTGSVAGMPAELSWRENFGAGAPVRTILDLKGRIPDIQTVRNLGIELGPLDDEYVKGAIGASVRFTVLKDRKTRIEVRADLEEADVDLAKIKWRKVSGEAARAEMNVSLADDKVRKIDHFALYAEDLAITGRADFEADGATLRRIDFSQVAYGRTDMKGALIRRADGAWDVGFHGRGLDLSAYYQDLLEDTSDQKMLDFVLAGEFEKIWLDDRIVLDDVSLTASHEQDLWRTILFRSVLNGEVPVQMSIEPGKDGNRNLLVETGDAGTLLRAVKVYDNMVGGALTMTGQFRDDLVGRPLFGRMLVRDYRVLKAPALAHVVSIMALTGILDALEGDGLGFAVLDIPFKLQDGVVEIKDARAAGPSLGFTASGAVYTHADVVDLEGTVVPAYALNSALGRIPLLGGIFTGGEKGSGLFAANFKLTGPQEDPKVSINPLSALTPGFLRRLFGLFDNAGDDGPPPAAADPSGQESPKK